MRFLRPSAKQFSANIIYCNMKKCILYVGNILSIYHLKINVNVLSSLFSKVFLFFIFKCDFAAFSINDFVGVFSTIRTSFPWEFSEGKTCQIKRETQSMNLHKKTSVFFRFTIAQKEVGCLPTKPSLDLDKIR